MQRSYRAGRVSQAMHGAFVTLVAGMRVKQGHEIRPVRSLVSLV